MSYIAGNNFTSSTISNSANAEWTEQEIQYILKYKNTKSHKELADVLGRTKSAVQQKLWKLTSFQHAPSQPTKTIAYQRNQTAKASDTDFSDDSNSDDESSESESDHEDENEQKQTVPDKQQKLKRAHKPWTDGDVQTLIALSTTETMQEIADILGRSKSSVSKKYRKIKKEQKSDDTVKGSPVGCNLDCVFETARSVKSHISRIGDETHQKHTVEWKAKKKKDRKLEKLEEKKRKQKSAEMQTTELSSPAKIVAEFTACGSTINITLNNVLPSVSPHLLADISPLSTLSTTISFSSLGSVFNDKRFALLGRLSMKQSEIEALIIRNGGKIDKSPTTETDFVVVKSQKTKINNTLCQNAMHALKIQFVIEQFIHDSIEGKKMLQAVNYQYVVKEEQNKLTKKQPMMTSDEFSFEDVNMDGSEFCVNNPKKRALLNTEDTADGNQPQSKRKKVHKLKWTVDDVASWLVCLNVAYSEYAAKFKEGMVSGELMNALDDDSLACIVKNPLHRKEILLGWKKLW